MEHGVYRACLQKKKTYGFCMDVLRIRIENVRIAYTNSPLGLDGEWVTIDGALRSARASRQSPIGSFEP